MKNTVLFVDDEVINLFVLERRFEEQYNVLTAQSGEEALEKISLNGASLNAIISDLRMPQMDGLELIGKAKEQLPNLPCFLLTGYDFNEQIEEALKENKISHLFKKPFDYNEIDQKLKEMI
ncbi:response regulator [Ekhidna sp.]